MKAGENKSLNDPGPGPHPSPGIFRPFHYRWEWQLQSSPEALWPLVADTNRFNRDTGLPVVEIVNRDATADARRRLRFSRFGIAVEWDEEPFEWVRPHRFSVVRRYRTGPVAEMRVIAELAPRPDGGTSLTYDVRAWPKNLPGLLAIPVQVGIISARRFDAIIRRYDQLAAGGGGGIQPAAASRPQPSFASGGRARLLTQRDKLLAMGAAPELVDRLIAVVEADDDLSLARIRPYLLADRWGARRRDALELCLLATRSGLLDLQWDLLCPLCRGAKQSSGTLAGVTSSVHCNACSIDFTVNFDRSVELTFRPNPAIRRVVTEEFCIGGPQITPHIVAQQLLAPAASRTLRVALEAGRYRLRAPGLDGEQPLLVCREGRERVTLRAAETGWSSDELRLTTTPTIELQNGTSRERLLILERTAWIDAAATAAEVAALQTFRDLFASEALRPGEQISVGNQTIVFTDLRDSTRFYREVGDARAFGSVMSHFDVLREAITAEDGAIVKTIGDAVMAVFTRPASALRAMLKAQRELAAPPDGRRPLMLKAGIHCGACIAVTLNGRLDYFGSTVNLAARLEGLSSGADVIVSAAVLADPEVAEMIGDRRQGLQVERIEARLKGFDAERFALWRVAAGGARD
jgi:class 3 adenylate cyclase